MKFVYVFIFLGFSLKAAVALKETDPYEAYLNKLKTLAGEFTQISSRGQTTTGFIQISRPGKMRLTYNAPSTLLIVADGKWLITKDRETDQVDYVSLDKTPAAFLLSPHIRFSEDIEVTSVIPKGETTEISLIRKDDPDAGMMTLVFQENPMALKEWSIRDGQGIETRVVLSKLKSNISLPPELFAIESPNLIQQIF